MTEESHGNDQHGSPLTDFLKRYGALSVAIMAAAGGPLITTAIKVAPPSPPAPERMEALSSLLSIPIILAAYGLNSRISPSARRRLVAVMVGLSLAFGVAYIGLYQAKTIALPTQDRAAAAKGDGRIAAIVYERIVIGNECTSEALQLNPKECVNQAELMKPDVLETYKSAGLPGSLWTMTSVQQNANTLLSLWFAVVASLSGTIGLLTANVASVQQSGKASAP
jgi:hypothetical protein